MSVNCPICNGKSDVHHAGGAPASVCRDCNAVWAEKGVLAQLLGTESDLRSTFPEGASTAWVCPADGGALSRVPYARLDETVTVSVCRTCDGILIEADMIPRLEALNERIMELFGDGTFTAKGRKRPRKLRRLLVRLLKG